MRVKFSIKTGLVMPRYHNLKRYNEKRSLILTDKTEFSPPFRLQKPKMGAFLKGRPSIRLNADSTSL